MLREEVCWCKAEVQSSSAKGERFVQRLSMMSGCNDRLGWLAINGLCWVSLRSVHVEWAWMDLATALWTAMLIDWIGMDPEAAMTGLW